MRAIVDLGVDLATVTADQEAGPEATEGAGVVVATAGKTSQQLRCVHSCSTTTFVLFYRELFNSGL